MESKICTISSVFHNGGNIHYVLPHFQREYIWDKEQWREFLRDLFSVYYQIDHADKPLIHFLGLMVLVPDARKSGTITRLKVVDGQQRLVTVSLIICILKELSKKKTKRLKEAEKTYCTEKMERMLFNDLEMGNERFKVLPSMRRGDCMVYTSILDGQPIKMRDSRIADAYRYLQREITKRLSDKEISTIEKLYSALVDSFQVALVSLDKDDEIESPYKIFESLDGKGRLLSQGDLVRNYIAMTLPLSLQKQVFEEVGSITPHEFAQLLLVVENLLVRRFLCSESQAALARWYTTVWDEILRRRETQSFLDACCSAFSSMKYYPTDRQLRQSVRVVKLYGTGRGKSNRAKITLILTTIEEHLWGDTEIVPTLRGNPTIEHIMPQTLTEAWKKELGEQGGQVHAAYLHTLGNLTLVTQGKNTQLSNAPFTVKRDLLLAQGFLLNKYFDKNIPYWNENAINMRADWLTQHILTIWPSLTENRPFA